MIWSSERIVKENEAGLEPEAAEELKQNKVSQSLDMLDKVLKLTESKTARRVATLWNYMVSILC